MLIDKCRFASLEKRTTHHCNNDRGICFFSRFFHVMNMTIVEWIVLNNKATSLHIIPSNLFAFISVPKIFKKQQCFFAKMLTKSVLPFKLLFLPRSEERCVGNTYLAS